MITRHVEAHLVADVDGPAQVLLQVAALTPARESLDVTIDGRPVAVVEVRVPGQGRVHRASPGTGRLEAHYRAVVADNGARPAVSAVEEILYLRPSRYAESDRLAAVALGLFGTSRAPVDLLADISSWVGTQLTYVPGSSRPTDGAVETLLQRSGVCRDYAHLVVALLRALDVPARLTAVYAPGLQPMDFHAVAEAAVDGTWCVVDATLLAPRPSLVRISSGRDAADTAFLSTYGGAVALLSTDVRAVVDGPLPSDDIRSIVSLGGEP